MAIDFVFVRKQVQVVADGIAGEGAHIHAVLYAKFSERFFLRRREFGLNAVDEFLAVFRGAAVDVDALDSRSGKFQSLVSHWRRP